MYTADSVLHSSCVYVVIVCIIMCDRMPCYAGVSDFLCVCVYVNVHESLHLAFVLCIYVIICIIMCDCMYYYKCVYD